MRKGLELAQLEAETKIRARYLRALEDERFDLLPADSYARGFLRLYADRLGLDSQLFVDEFTSRFSTGEEARLTRQPDSRRLVGRRLEAQIVLIALASIVAVTVLVIAAWRLGDSEPATQPTERPPPAAPTAAPPPAAPPPAAPPPAAPPPAAPPAAPPADPPAEPPPALPASS
jgi:cytoskeletal protein RodZ